MARTLIAMIATAFLITIVTAVNPLKVEGSSFVDASTHQRFEIIGVEFVHPPGVGYRILTLLAISLVAHQDMIRLESRTRCPTERPASVTPSSCKT